MTMGLSKVDNNYISSLIKRSVNADLSSEITQAETIDLRNIMGDKIWNDFNNGDLPELLSGGNYDGLKTTYTYPSVKDVVSYFAYARYSLLSPFTDTDYGVFQRTSEHTRVITDEQRKEMYQYYRNIAVALYAGIADYLECEKSEKSTLSIIILS